MAFSWKNPFLKKKKRMTRSPVLLLFKVLGSQAADHWSHRKLPGVNMSLGSVSTKAQLLYTFSNQ